MIIEILRKEKFSSKVWLYGAIRTDDKALALVRGHVRDHFVLEEPMLLLEFTCEIMLLSIKLVDYLCEVRNQCDKAWFC